MNRFYIFVYVLAALVVAPAVGQAPLDTNILRNPSFESASPDGWLGAYGHGQWDPPRAHEGASFYYGGDGDAVIGQVLDLTVMGYDATRLATGGYSVTYGGWQACWPETWPSPWDQGLIRLEQLTGGGTSNGSANLGWQYPSEWTEQSGTLRLNASTTVLQYIFEADRADWNPWGHNDAYLDSAYVKLHAYNIWTSGANTVNYAGDELWYVKESMTIGQNGTGFVGVEKTQWLTGDAESDEFVFVGGSSWGSGNGRVDIANGGWWAARGLVGLGLDGTGVINVNSGGALKTYHDVTIWNGEINLTAGGEWVSKDYFSFHPTTVIVGYARGPGDLATVNVNAGSSWHSLNRVEIGARGDGVVNVRGTWTSDETVVAGCEYGQDMTAQVNVQGGHWQSNRQVIVGQAGPSTVSIDPAGVWTSNGTVQLGEMLFDYNGAPIRGTGTVNVSQGGVWNSNARVEVGSRGTGQVNLGAGGRWNSTGSVILGYEAGTSGTVDVSNGHWQASGPVTVGQAGSGSVSIRGAAGRFDVNGQMLTVGPAGRVTLDGGSLNITNGYANFAGPLEFTDGGGTVNLDNSYLMHVGRKLELNGGEIRGSGGIHVGAAGLDLGSAARPGTVEGDAAFTMPLTIYGDVSGSGTLSNLAVYGYVSVGNSPGLLNLQNVTLAGTSPLLMEIAGTDPSQFDRLILQNVLFGSAGIRIAFADGFSPQVSDTFDLFDGPNLFAELTGASISTPAGWLLDYSTGVLHTPEPASLVLLALGAALLRRRRA